MGAEQAPHGTPPWAALEVREQVGECDPDLTLTAEEKALAFMLFDLTSCTGPKVAPPPLCPPPPPPGPPPPTPPLPPPPPPADVVGTLRVIEQR